MQITTPPAQVRHGTLTWASLSLFYSAYKTYSSLLFDSDYIAFLALMNEKWILKGTVHSKIKNIFFLLPVELFINLYCLLCELSSFGDIGHRDFYLFSNIMVLAVPKIQLKNSTVMSVIQKS